MADRFPLLEQMRVQRDERYEVFRGPLALGEPVPAEENIVHRLEVRVPSVSYTHMICDLHEQAERGFRD